jgi:hypothetical protein
MAAKLDVSVISPEKLLFHGDADSIVVPGSEGFFGVYPGHTSLVSLLGIGVLEVRQGNKTKIAAIEGGFFEVRDNRPGCRPKSPRRSGSSTCLQREKYSRPKSKNPNFSGFPLIFRGSKFRKLLRDTSIGRGRRSFPFKKLANDPGS